MKIIGKISAKRFVSTGITGVVLTILFCYSLAVGLHHRKPWLPTISECGDKPPEQYFFRWGMMMGAVVLIVHSVLLDIAQWSSKVTFYLGLVAGLCLSGVSVVGDNEDNTVHSTMAVTFFVCQDLRDLLLIFESYKRLTFTTQMVMIFSTLVACVCTAARIILIVRGISVMEEGVPWLPILEWTNTAAILSYELSTAQNLGGIFLAGAEDINDKAPTN